MDKGSIQVAVFGAACCLLLAIPGLERQAVAHAAGPPAVEAVPIELDPETPGRRRIGGLTFLSGFELRSADSRFGGLSGLALSADGDSLYAVSDNGYWLTARLRHDANGRLAGLTAWEIAPLLTPEGRVLRGQLRDAEALARDQDGSLIVAFEHAHRVWRYPPPPAAFTAPAQPLRAPAELADAPANGGLEAVTVLPDGSLLALAEEFKNPDGSLKGWLIEKIGFALVSYLPSKGFSPTDLATLASGDVLLLERRYSVISGPAARIRRLSGASVRAAARLQGEVIAQLELPLAVDNFEGLAVREDPEMGTLLYLISDDNFSPLQRTLLLQFRLDALFPPPHGGRD
ncbi:MAG: esterase-like activity of phytase family protein [Candidatus Methylomirabilia bacterium]